MLYLCQAGTLLRRRVAVNTNRVQQRVPVPYHGSEINRSCPGFLILYGGTTFTPGYVGNEQRVIISPASR